MEFLALKICMNLNMHQTLLTYQFCIMGSSVVHIIIGCIYNYIYIYFQSMLIFALHLSVRTN